MFKKSSLFSLFFSLLLLSRTALAIYNPDWLTNKVMVRNFTNQTDPQDMQPKNNGYIIEAGVFSAYYRFDNNTGNIDVTGLNVGETSIPANAGYTKRYFDWQTIFNQWNGYIYLIEDPYTYYMPLTECEIPDRYQSIYIDLYRRDDGVFWARIDPYDGNSNNPCNVELMKFSRTP